MRKHAIEATWKAGHHVPSRHTCGSECPAMSARTSWRAVLPSPPCALVELRMLQLCSFTVRPILPPSQLRQWT